MKSSRGLPCLDVGILQMFRPFAIKSRLIVLPFFHVYFLSSHFPSFSISFTRGIFPIYRAIYLLISLSKRKFLIYFLIYLSKHQLSLLIYQNIFFSYIYLSASFSNCSKPFILLTKLHISKKIYIYTPRNICITRLCHQRKVHYKNLALFSYSARPRSF